MDMIIKTNRSEGWIKPENGHQGVFRLVRSLLMDTENVLIRLLTRADT